MSYFIRLNLVGVGFIYQQLLEMILMNSLLIGRDDKFFVGLGYCQGIVKCIYVWPSMYKLHIHN